MANQRGAQRRGSTLICLTVCAGGLLFAPGNLRRTFLDLPDSATHGQSVEKTITLSERDDDKVELSDLRLGETKITSGKKFNLAATLGVHAEVSEEDWLENFGLTIESKADKRITCVQFELQFPDTEASGPLMVYRDFAAGYPPGVRGSSAK
jgi:hypothetical protein